MEDKLSSPSQASISRHFIFLAFLFFSIFVFCRFYQLDVRPMHNDESVNAWFLMNLIKSNSYKYDPSNYHGPSIYYIQVIPTWLNGLFIEGIKNFRFNHIAGVTDRSVRFVVVVVSLVLLLGVLMTRIEIGPWGAFTAYLMLGFSCDYLYYSR